MSLTLSNGHRPPPSPPQSLRTMTVQSFFSQVAWEGKPTLAPWSNNGDTELRAMPLSLRMTVGEFFSRFMWEGTPEIAAPGMRLDASPPPSEVDTFTLDDFSSLF
ncbi:hypothetical protein [Leptolyngbya sp. PCC 6406]|uniref:hypothetical protein n=1 Tax=Leptolyngbya sp. PCC 6406 TaxID=1173264 RepID=UPI0002ACB349|nr:hypothetical protein [Leptolyngbya sp. PCC 6406]